MATKITLAQAYMRPQMTAYGKLKNYGEMANCCGTQTINGFGQIPEDTDLADLDKFITRFTNNYSVAKGKGMILICTLTNRQEAWFPELKKRGFRVVNKWRNQNSCNTLRLFILDTSKQAKKTVKKQLDIVDTYLKIT